MHKIIYNKLKFSDVTLSIAKIYIQIKHPVFFIFWYLQKAFYSTYATCEYKLHFVFKEKVTYSSIWSVLHFCRLYCLTKIIKTLIKILKPHDIVTQAAFKLVICNTVLTKYNLTKLKDSAPAPLYQPILHVQLLTQLKKNFLFLFFMSIHFGVLVCLEQLCIFRLLHCMLGKFICK